MRKSCFSSKDNSTSEADAEKALGKSFWDVYTPVIPKHVLASESAKSLIARFDKLSSTGKADWLLRPVETEIALNLTHKFVQINIFPIKTQKGFRIGSIWRDVTNELKLATIDAKQVSPSVVSIHSIYTLEKVGGEQTVDYYIYGDGKVEIESAIELSIKKSSSMKTDS